MAVKKIVIVLAAVCFMVSAAPAKKITEGFESKDAIKKWESEGEPVISTVQKHTGKNSLSVPSGSSTIWRPETANKFGSVTIWVYDSCVIKSSAKNWNGPYFGLINEDDDRMVLLPVWRSFIGADCMAVIFTAEAQWSGPWYTSRFKRSEAGWNKYTFNCPDDKSISAVRDDEVEAAAVPGKLEFFNKGFNGVCFGYKDGLEKGETFFFDDIEINTK